MLSRTKRLSKFMKVDLLSKIRNYFELIHNCLISELKPLLEVIAYDQTDKDRVNEFLGELRVKCCLAKGF